MSNKPTRELLRAATKARKLGKLEEQAERLKAQQERIEAQQALLNTVPDLSPHEIAKLMLDNFTQGKQAPRVPSWIILRDPTLKEPELYTLKNILRNREKVCDAFQAAITDLEDLNKQVRRELEKVAEINQPLAEKAAVLLTTNEWSIKHALNQ